MGITIHYSGRAKNWDALTKLLDTASMFAAHRGWMFAVMDDVFGVMDDRDPNDPGYIETDEPVRTVILRPHKQCEPVRFAFSPTCEMVPGFTKTQFAPFKIHVEIVALLHAIEPFMETLEVADEAGLWETGDQLAARKQFQALGSLIQCLGDSLHEAGVEVDGTDALFDHMDDSGLAEKRGPEDEPYG